MIYYKKILLNFDLLHFWKLSKVQLDFLSQLKCTSITIPCFEWLAVGFFQTNSNCRVMQGITWLVRLLRISWSIGRDDIKYSVLKHICWQTFVVHTHSGAGGAKARVETCVMLRLCLSQLKRIVQCLKVYNPKLTPRHPLSIFRIRIFIKNWSSRVWKFRVKITRFLSKGARFYLKKPFATCQLS